MSHRLQRRLTRFQEVAEAIRYGLRSTPFRWDEWERKLNVAAAAVLGCTLLTKSALESRGYRLKRGAKPAGCAYFGAPIQRMADLYVLEAHASPRIKAKEVAPC